MEEFKRQIATRGELRDAVRGKDPIELDYDQLLARGRNQDVFRSIHHIASDALRAIPGGEDKWRQAIADFYTAFRDDENSDWWLTRRTNELLGSPLKMGALPYWARPENR